MNETAASKSDTMMLCASCGIAGGVDDIKLMDCDGCDLVRYCSDACQEDHRPRHEEECKKRADELLFKQPESSHLGDCTICFVPLPMDLSESTLYTCCSKLICNGCSHANKERETEGLMEQKCPFCRKALPSTKEERFRRMMKRVEAKDPVAMWRMGIERFREGNYEAAFEFFTNAAALGDLEAHYQLSILYLDGLGVEKDEKKQLYHLIEASIGGHPYARNNLCCAEWKNGSIDRAVKHLIIAAKQGNDHSLEQVKRLFKAGCVSKEDFEAALRGHKAAIEATKSPQREKAAEALRKKAERERRGL